jgi:predicted Rossmann-fold nucleotide-binding protein
MPDFSTRYELLNFSCIAAISGIGGPGTNQEQFGVVVDNKTGIRNTPLYVNDPYIETLGRTFYEPLRMQMQGAINCGLDDQATLESIHFKDNPEQIFTHLMEKLQRENRTPDELYAAYCRTHSVAPGIPKAWQKKGVLLIPATE